MRNHSPLPSPPPGIYGGRFSRIVAVHFLEHLNRSTFFFPPSPRFTVVSKRLTLSTSRNERGIKETLDPGSKKITMSIQWKKNRREREREGGDRCNAIDTSHCALGRTQGVVFIDINGKRRGDSRLFRGCVEKFNRRMRSDASVMHRSRASVGANLLCARGRRRRWKNERDAGIPWHGARCPSSSNYRAFISWKTSPPLSLVHCHRWPFLPSGVWCNQKKIEDRVQRPTNSSARSRERNDSVSDNR